MNRGFLLLEILLALFLTGILWLGLSTLYLAVGNNWLESSGNFDFRQQQRIIGERIVRKIRLARPETIFFGESFNSNVTYGRIEMELNFEPQRKIAFYQRGNNVLQGVKNPGQTVFSGMSLGLGLEKLEFKPQGRAIRVKIKTENKTLTTYVIPRGEVFIDE